jgi:hypothetical protein
MYLLLTPVFDKLEVFLNIFNNSQRILNLALKDMFFVWSTKKTHPFTCHFTSLSDSVSHVIPSKHTTLTLGLLMSYIYGAPNKTRNLTLYIYERYFLLGILLFEDDFSGSDNDFLGFYDE